MIRPFILAASIVASTTAAWALNAGNAGPEKVELKFKLPPPKPLSPEEALKTFKVAPRFQSGAVRFRADDRVPGFDELG